MKVYKFRSLGDCKSLERIEQILTAREFRCSRFWELNDPMEGIYRLNWTSNSSDIESLFKHKASHLICSFSDGEALRSPLMWGYYANGFKGVAIEVEVGETQLKQVQYFPCLFSPEAGADAEESARKILCRKLEPWKHEREWRFLCAENRDRCQQIGRITGVVIGYPYPRSNDHPDFDDRWKKVEEYDCRVKRLIETAREQKIVVQKAHMVNGTVTIQPWKEGRRRRIARPR